MTHEIFVLLRAALKAKGVPVECIYGPTQVPMKVGASRLQMLRDYEAGDRVVEPYTQRANPRQVAVRMMGAKILVFAHSALDGAARHNHERLAEQIVDMAHVCMHDIVLGALTLWRITKAGFLPDATTDGWAGVVYELRFQIDRGVADLTWAGEAAAEADFTTATTSLEADGPGVNQDLPSATTRVN